MSNIYIQEPPTNGKVLLVTSIGDIDVELWSKEAPKTCRNFVQLCLDGYYDGTIFHRVIHDFIAQGGEHPSGETVTVADEDDSKPLKMERHSRLRYVRRGLVSAASDAAPQAGSQEVGGGDTTRNQFFFTLAPTPELQDKHTIFGKVAGDTLYNMLKFNDIVTEGDSDRPLHPPHIIKTQILSNPFDDLYPRQMRRKVKKVKDKAKSKSKATKDFKLLSFGSEAEEDEQEVEQITKDVYGGKSKSIHDAGTDPTLISQPATDDITSSSHGGKQTTSQSDLSSIREKLKRKADDVKESVAAAAGDPDSDDDVAAKRMEKLDDIRREGKRLRRELRRGGGGGEEGQKVPPAESRGNDITANDDVDVGDRNALAANDNAQGTEKVEEKTAAGNSKGIVREYKRDKAPYVEKRVEMKRRDKADRERQTLALLSRFEGKLHSVVADGEGGSDNDEVRSNNNEGRGDNDEANKGDSNEGQGHSQRAEEEEIKDLSWTRYKLVSVAGAESAAVSKAKDASLPAGEDTYDIHDPRNEIVKRRREKSKQVMKEQRRGGRQK